MKEAEFDNFRKLDMSNPGCPGFGPMYAYCALACIALYRRTGTDRYRGIAKKMFRRIRRLVHTGNKNLLHFDSLIEAELGDTHPRNSRRNAYVCRTKYDIAIFHANRSGFIHEEALAHELVGDFLRRERATEIRRSKGSNADVADVISGGIRIEEEAKAHYGRAVQLYQEWGVPYRCERIIYGSRENQSVVESSSTQRWKGLRRLQRHVGKDYGHVDLASEDGERHRPPTSLECEPSSFPSSMQPIRAPLDMIIQSRETKSSELMQTSPSVISGLPSIREEP